MANPIFDAIHHTFSSAGNAAHLAAQEAINAQEALQRPSYLFRPRLSLDGDMWCALYGDDIATGVVGFGKSPADAMAAFDSAWHTPVINGVTNG